MNHELTGMEMLFGLRRFLWGIASNEIEMHNFNLIGSGFWLCAHNFAHVEGQQLMKLFQFHVDSVSFENGEVYEILKSAFELEMYQVIVCAHYSCIEYHLSILSTSKLL